jgi:triosephosphate isomerase (TIM)
MTLKRRPLILGNWKMHGGYDANSELINALLAGFKSLRIQKAVDVGVCVPSVYLSHTEDLCYGTDLQYGTQDCSAYSKGAYTGDVSAAMLAEFGVHYVLVGHSERRQYQQESDHGVALKAQQALQSGVTPVICIGETLEQREAQQTLAVLTEQLQAVIEILGASSLSDCVIAYEPVWAIGTGKTASPEQAQQVHQALRQWLSAQGADAQAIRLLYGGSMKPDNASRLLAQADIDGGLIGGAALIAEDFLSIVQAAMSAAMSAEMSAESSFEVSSESSPESPPRSSPKRAPTLRSAKTSANAA